MRNSSPLRFVAAVLALWAVGASGSQEASYQGKYFSGSGDVEYLQLLDVSRRFFDPDPEYQNLPMLYTTGWNGFVEGPTWDAWWIQNSYGPTYCALPFLVEPYTTFLQNSHDLWFDQMGDGKRVGAPPPFNWIAPDGALCDAARPGWIVYKQGDGRVDLHDWGMEFTAAGLLMQAELLLISRDREAIARYLPKLERCAEFVETRRDPVNNLFLAGPAGNLLAPSYAGWQRPDGQYGQAYLAGLSITYIAALDRLIELERLAGRFERAAVHEQRREAARKGLKLLTTEEDYFIRSLDPDGTKHGVFGAPKHGYFEASPNHDAIALRVVDDTQAHRIYKKIASIPALRPYQFIIPNYPSYDDMYEKPEGLWSYGTWVNGGHWSTCEARMILAYCRLGCYDDARRSMNQLLTFARRFRMDNPLVRFGSDVYQPAEPINLTYDAFGPPAAMLRGLFEYLYKADGLTLLPHIPPGILRLEQLFPVRFGSRRLYLATVGSGPITAVSVNGRAWTAFDKDSVFLSYEPLPDIAAVEIAMGGAALRGWQAPRTSSVVPAVPEYDVAWQRLRKTNLLANALPLRIGADSNGNNRFRGRISRPRIFRRALAAEEIAAAARGDARQLDQDPALVAAWSLAQLENGVFVCDRGRGLEARPVGTVQPDTGPIGPAIRLDGQGYLEVSDQPALDLTECCTLEAWICPEQLPHGGGRILDKSQAGTSNGYLLDTYPGNSIRLIAQAGILDHDARLTPGQWVHVAATVRPDGRLALYLQGRCIAEKAGSSMPDVPALLARAHRLREFHRLLADSGLSDSYEAAHARLVLEFLATAHARFHLLAAGKLKPLSDEGSQSAADASYFDAASRLARGLTMVLENYERSPNPRQQQIFSLWRKSAASQN